FAYQNGEAAAWWRPGKGRGQSISVTTNYAGSGYVYVFSTSTDFPEAGRAYGKFAAYAYLHHSGDFTAAARELARRGFSSTASLSQSPTSEPEPVNEDDHSAAVAYWKARALRAEEELQAIKAVLFDAKDYTLTERVVAIAHFEDVDQL